MNPPARRRLLAVALAASWAVTPAGQLASAVDARTVDTSTAGSATVGSTAAGTESGRWMWPILPEPQVTRGFQPPPQVWMAGHRGVDLAAETSAGVLSPAAGTVVFVGVVVDRPVLTIRHENGVLSSFEPVTSSLQTGQRVEPGMEVGVIAGAGHCRSGCLHWGTRLNGVYVDPLDFVLDRRPSVLLPLTAG